MPALKTLLAVLEALMRARGFRRHRLSKDGVDLSYHAYRTRRTGGRSIVLVHGLGTSTIQWIKVFGALGRRNRVWALDLPGWGYSPFPNGRDFATIPDLTRAVVSFLETVPGGPVVLVGQSLGGWVAAKVAAQRPDLVEELVLCNNAGVRYPEIADLRRKLDLRNYGEVVDFWKDLWHRVPSLYRFFTEDYVAKMHEPRVVGFFDSLREEDFINEDLARIEAPTSILWGMNDRFIPIQTVDTMIERLKDARVYWIPDCGHIPPLERPREFLRIMKAILRQPPSISTGMGARAEATPSEASVGPTTR